MAILARVTICGRGMRQAIFRQLTYTELAAVMELPDYRCVQRRNLVLLYEKRIINKKASLGAQIENALYTAGYGLSPGPTTSDDLEFIPVDPFKEQNVKPASPEEKAYKAKMKARRKARKQVKKVEKNRVKTRDASVVAALKF